MATDGERRSGVGASPSEELESAPEKATNLPLAAPAALRKVFAVLADREAMLAVFQHELPRLARASLRVTSCKAKVQRSREALREGRIRIVYHLRVAHGDGGEERDLVVLGTAPESAEFLSEDAVRALRGHPALVPFDEPALHVAELQLGLRIYPLDPSLPGLAELEGPGGAELIERHPPAHAPVQRVERLERELRHYKPFKRAVLRLRAFAPGSHEPRVVYAKVFADERGAGFDREQRALWEATRHAQALRIPEPLGYDPVRRVMLMAEAPGRPDLIDWIKSLENHRSLPTGASFERVQQCVAVAAQALAELQATGIQPRLVRGYREHLVRVDKYLPLLRGELAQRHPELTRASEELVRRLEERVPAHEELLPAHGGFRHKQMVGDEDTLTVIDWDGLCRADPALDAATFLLRLRQEPLREPGSAPEMERLAEAFRNEFLARVPRVSPAQLALHEALALTLGTLRSFRRAAKDDGMERTISNLAAAAGEALDRARPADLRASPAPAKKPGKKSIAPLLAGRRRELFERIVDKRHMLEVFRSTLPALADGAVRVTRCKLKQRRRRVALREERLELIYRVGVELADGTEREVVLFGSAPEPAEFAGRDQGRLLAGHPMLVPFRSATAYVPELELALRIFPLDPGLPGLAELTGPDGARVVAAVLPECRAGAELRTLECHLRQYKPFKRAVLRLVAHYAIGASRTLYAKLFVDGRGEETFEGLLPLYAATHGVPSLRVPEPVGYDAVLRTLFLAEAPGLPSLTQWVECLEKDRPLPPGVDRKRMERCVAVVAQAAADLRHSGIRPQRVRTFGDELGRLHRDLDSLEGKAEAGALGIARRLVTELEALAPASNAMVPVHGCFRHKQMVGDEHGLAVIDWDGLCLGQPGLDAATFVCHLRRKLVRKSVRSEELEHLASTFRREFLARCSDVTARELALCEALVWTQDLLRAFRRPADRAESALQVQTLAHAAWEKLDELSRNRTTP